MEAMLQKLREWLDGQPNWHKRGLTLDHADVKMIYDEIAAANIVLTGEETRRGYECTGTLAQRLTFMFSNMIDLIEPKKDPNKCTICQQTWVDTANGEDTCPPCLERV